MSIITLCVTEMFAGHTKLQSIAFHNVTFSRKPLHQNCSDSVAKRLWENNTVGAMFTQRPQLMQGLGSIAGYIAPGQCQ